MAQSTYNLHTTLMKNLPQVYLKFLQSVRRRFLVMKHRLFHSQMISLVLDGPNDDPYLYHVMVFYHTLFRSPTMTTAAPRRWHDSAHASPTGPAPATYTVDPGPTPAVTAP